MKTPTAYHKNCAAFDFADWDRIKKHLIREREIALAVAVNVASLYVTPRIRAKARATVIRRTIQLAIVRAHHRRIDTLRGDVK